MTAICVHGLAIAFHVVLDELALVNLAVGIRLLSFTVSA
jgi:hypothetical protein